MFRMKKVTRLGLLIGASALTLPAAKDARAKTVMIQAADPLQLRRYPALATARAGHAAATDQWMDARAARGSRGAVPVYDSR